MTTLERTGFFREMAHGEPSDPSLVAARMAGPVSDHAQIAAYLDAGHVYIATPGPALDVFDPDHQIDPPHLRTDGRFLWPGDLAYYVRTYRVRVDPALSDHMRAGGWTVPGDVELGALQLPQSGAASAGGGDDEATAVYRRIDPARTAPAGTTAETEASAALAGVIADLVAPLVGGAELELSVLQPLLASAAHEIARAARQLRTDLPEQLWRSLGTLISWLQLPEAARAASLETAMASLQPWLDEAIAAQRRSADQVRSARLADQARTTITARLQHARAGLRGSNAE